MASDKELSYQVGGPKFEVQYCRERESKLNVSKMN
jgi:hypothetical protein